MRVLIVGGTSSIAISLKPVLLEFCEVFTTGRKYCDLKFDLNDPVESISIPPQLDAIVHTAASFGGTSDEKILEAENVNVLGTLKLCQAAVKANVKHFIFISSIYSTLNENDKQYSIYSLSKKHAEEVARFYCAGSSLPLTILRPSQIYGIGEKFKTHQPFFYTILEKAQNNEDVTLYGSHDPARNYIYVDDLSIIISKVIRQKVEGTFTCAHSTDVTYSKIAHAAFNFFRSKGTVRFLKDKPDLPDHVFKRDDSLYKKINFYPMTSMEEGIKKIAEARGEIK